jgi:hypothetical protein
LKFEEDHLGLCEVYMKPFLAVFLASCTFEDYDGDPTCRWRNQNDKYQWKRANQGTASLDTGPSFDHTFGTSLGRGKYILKNRIEAFETLVYVVFTCARRILHVY